MIHYQQRDQKEELLSFQHKDKIRARNGGFTSTWIPFHEVRAFIRPLKGSEQKSNTESTHRAYLPSMPILKDSDRMTMNKEVYTVTNIHNPMNADRQLIVELQFIGGEDTCGE